MNGDWLTGEVLEGVRRGTVHCNENSARRRCTKKRRCMEAVHKKEVVYGGSARRWCTETIHKGGAQRWCAETGMKLAVHGDRRQRATEN